MVFQDTFRRCPSLLLQDLTKADIERYVTEKFDRNNAFKILMEREPELAAILIKKVVENADGVFLWVRLVVISLLTGSETETRYQIS
jgi:hypothetical protein